MVLVLAVAVYAVALLGNGSSARASVGCATTGRQTFTSTGENCYVVGAGVDHLLITAVGAPGGSLEDGSGVPADALGSEATAVVPVSAGTLYVDVGGAGGSGVDQAGYAGSYTAKGGAGGWNGGAPGGAAQVANNTNGGRNDGISGGGGGGA
ncbi:MAG: hypothetical protein ACRDMJ_13990, partial [Solirubrobacteraceae bacterium]